MATTVMSVDALRVPVINFLMDASEKYSRIQFDNEATNSVSEDNQYVAKLEDNVPEGYWCEEKRITSESYGSVRYLDHHNDYIFLNFFPTSTDRVVDAENIEYESIEIGPYFVAVGEKNGYSAIWTDLDNKVAYSLYVKGLNFESFLKIIHAVLAE